MSLPDKERTLLPDNRTVFETAFEKGTKQLVKTENVYEWLNEPYQTKPELLDLMAQERGVLDWFHNDSIDVRQDTVGNAYKVHQKSGTKAGIKQALDDIGFAGSITPWYQLENAKPYSMQVLAWGQHNQPVTEDAVTRLYARIDNIKSERDTVILSMTYAISTSLAITAASAVATTVAKTSATALLWPVINTVASIGMSAFALPAVSINQTRVIAKFHAKPIRASASIVATCNAASISINHVYTRATQ